MPYYRGMRYPVILGRNTYWWSLLYGDDVALAIDFANERTYNGGVQSTPTDLLTYTAPSPKLVYGADGLLGYAPHNLLTYAQAFENAAWTKAASSVTADSIPAPDGTITADKLIESATTAVHYAYQSFSVTAGISYTLAIYLKAGERTRAWLYAASIAEAVAYFNLSDGTVSATAGSLSPSASISDVGNGYYRCSITFRPSSTISISMGCGPTTASGTTNYAGDGTSGIYVWGAQLNRGPTALTYIPTTTAARYSIPLDHDPVTLEPLGVLVEEQRTNLALYSDDFTNAAWVKTNVTAAKTATGPDGVANSASTLTATAANATALQSITSASAARITSVFIKRRTGTGAVEMTQDNGTTWASVTVTAGWTRVSIASATVTNPVVGFRIVTSGDAIDVDILQQEVGAFTTSPIPTVASQVTRAADNSNLLASAFPYNAAEGTLFASVTDVASISAVSYMAVLSNGNTSEFMGIRYASSNPITLVIDNSVTQVTLDAGTAVLGAAKLAAALKAADFAASYKGGAAVVAASGSMPTPTTLYVGSSNGAAAFLNGHIASLAYWPTRKSDAYIQQVTA